MMLPDVFDLFGYWQDHPPLHETVEMVARYLGIKKSHKVPDRAARPGPENGKWWETIEDKCTAQDLSSLVALTGKSLIVKEN